MSHTHEIGGVSHSHADHGHTHEILDGPGSYIGREMPIIEGRNWSERAFTVGIGGYVVSMCLPVQNNYKEGKGLMLMRLVTL
jgi:urease accessory protein